MITIGANFPRLKTNLRLAINRLKLMEKKKNELAVKMRKEVADYISRCKIDLAKAKVEHVIMEDYLVEAMGKVAVYCELVLGRFGLIQRSDTVNPSISEAVSSIVWVAPYLLNDIPELKIVAEQLTANYGKPFLKACRENFANTVNEELINQVTIATLSDYMVENYLMEIAKSHNIAYVPARKSVSNTWQPPNKPINFVEEEKLSSKRGKCLCNFENTPSTSGGQSSNVCPSNQMPKESEAPQSLLLPPPYSSLDFELPSVSELHQQPSKNPNYSELHHSENVIHHDNEKINLELPVVPDMHSTSSASHEFSEIQFDDITERLEKLKCMK